MRPLGLLLLATSAVVVFNAGPMSAGVQPSLTSFAGVLAAVREAPHIPATIVQTWTHGYDSFRHEMQNH